MNRKNSSKKCKDMDEVMKLANEENVELTDEQLEFLGSGGCGCEGPSLGVSTISN